MPIYQSDSQLYASFQELFGIIERHDPRASDALLKAALAITFVCSAPTAAITINARKAPVQLLYGATQLQPTIEVGLTADTLHCLLLGEMRLSKAIGADLVTLKGPVWKTLSLADLFHYAQQYYPGVLQAHGLPATCPGLSRE
jgi:hypothetical protein